MPYFDPMKNEWVYDDELLRPSTLPFGGYSSAAAQAEAADLESRDFGGYRTDPNRPLMGQFSNVAPPAVQSEPAYGGEYRQTVDPFTNQRYSQWPTDEAWVATPETRYADMGDPNQATGLADWLARSMARATPGSQDRANLLQFYQAPDPLRGIVSRTQDRHVEPSSYPGAPRTIPWTPEMMRPPIVTEPPPAARALDFGQVRTPDPDFFQEPDDETMARLRRTQSTRDDEGPPRVSPIGTEGVPRDIAPARPQPSAEMRRAIADAENADMLSAVVRGETQPIGMTEPDDDGNRYEVMGVLRDPDGGEPARVVNVNGQLMIYIPDRGYVSLNQDTYRRLVDPRLFRAVTPRF